MILIVCVDDDMGMLFNDRRQSQDSILREHILNLTKNAKLWMNHYSARQFESDITPQINIDESFLREAASGEYCFSENVDVSDYEQWIERIILYRWNRHYPSELRFCIDLSKWQLTDTQDFPGSSHGRITMEVYVR